MKEGDKLVEKYTGCICVVLSVHADHILVEFEDTGFKFMVRSDSYKNYTVKES